MGFCSCYIFEDEVQTFVHPQCELINKWPACNALIITYWNEVDTEDHDTSEKERGRLAEAPGAVLKQYQGN